MKKFTLFFIKFFKEEKYADEFIKGNLYFNRLSYFKGLEEEGNDETRGDKNEGVFAWLQKEGMKINLTAHKESGEEFLNTTITDKDLAGPISMSLDYHNYFHVFCIYAVQASDFNRSYETEEERDLVLSDINEKINKEILIDSKCFEFGDYAVIVDKQKFLNSVKNAFEKNKIPLSGKLVEYYDEETFNGEIPLRNVIFNKQKKYSYQNEYRLAFNSNTTGIDPRTINIGSIAEYSLKTETKQVNNLIKIEVKPNQ